MNNTPIDIKDIQIVLDLRGEPTSKDNICLSSSHGYDAYVSTSVDMFVYELFREMSIWSNSTNTYTTHDYRYYKQFELDCSVKEFLKSRVFKKICEHHDVNFVILDNGNEDNQTMREFWDQMRR